ncbi:ERV/ALR sulfhydryl oxidase domain-containing protein [Calycina marina]|uniref:Sulfhydryl oxidase n=1 Tax=Calycina marina TaxID=1763456 RepID=A0A9P7ZAV9_9HELO|nr:ERV/ALR sulfhydryl oxidase domain-containing protein [Calycina marina]
MPRRQHITVWLVLGIIAFLSFWSILSFRHETGRSIDGFTPILQSELSLDDGVLKGEATAAKMENATLKAELGNAAWKVLHTTMAKFPDKPTEEDSQALKSYLHLFARLYPCGECARHFQKLLAKFPPQVTSRSSAAAWACHVHNQVNIRLKKEEFDCSKIGDFYDCGCADDEPVVKMDTFKQLELEKEGLTRGG